VSGGLSRACLVAAGLLGGGSVAAGAFGAHALRATLESSGQAANWETACRYATFHALALAVTGITAALPGAARSSGVLAAAATCFAVGTLVFSGCLGILALTGMRWLGAVVPVGGVLLVAGWALVALAGFRLADATRSATDR
jgi:uncharacterized membrane protein YgdD (TMEM256/DUF423 family)